MKEWEKNIRRVEPYIPGEQPQEENPIKLNTNENPYPPAPGVESLVKRMDTDSLRKYPDPACTGLTFALAEYYGVEKEEVFTGVGSDDVLAVCFLTFFNSQKPLLFPDISYSFYKVWAELFRIPYETPALDKEFHICPEDYKKENGGVIFPNPNAPTGLYMNLKQVEDIVKWNQDVVVIVDEAYIDFGGESALPLTKKYNNLLIVQTFSKSRSMAGLRIGFAIGNRDLIQAMNHVKYSYNSYTMNTPSLLLGVEALKDKVYFREVTSKIMETREWAKGRFRELGFFFPDSMANFLFVSHPSCSAEEIFEALKKEHIYVRYFKQERLSDYLRITIGTRGEMEVLFDFLERYLKEG
ncbi:histidinol-phosphate transaminase [Lachnospiraceae bacterium 62-35]